MIDKDTLNFNKVELILDNDFDTLGKVNIYWDYGDGEYDKLSDTSHFYWFKNGGNHQVTLRLLRNDEETEITKSINLPSLAPNFKATVLDTANRNKFTFYDKSIFVINTDSTKIKKKRPDKISVKYYWNFGNGNDSTYIVPGDFQTPVDSMNYEYPEGGTFPVTLRIKQGEESKEITKSIYIPSLSIDFDIQHNNQTDTNEVTFVPHSQFANGATYTWDFGDGTRYENKPYQSITHPYENGGIYVVTLTVAKGSEVKQISKVVNLPTLGIDFSYQLDNDNPKIVTFTPIITNASNIQYYKWNFGDGTTPVTYFNDNTFSYTYTSGGFYAVTLTVKQGDEIKSVTKSFTIQSITACFTSNIPIDIYNVLFKNCSKNTQGATFYWDFGDGTNSAQENPPIHTYSTGGIYNVSLTVTHGSETKTHTQSVGISVLKPCFNYSTSNYTVNFDANCSLNTLNSAIYRWNFGDGTTGTGKTPIHTYNTGSVYDVVLEIEQGPETKTLSKSVSIAALIPDFNVVIPSNCPAPCEISFTSTSQNVPNDATFSWSFGDSGTGTGANTTHTYMAGGVYTVIMTINTNGVDYSVSKIVDIPALTASFNVIGGGCDASCAVTIENTSTNVPPGYTYHWNYGVTSDVTINNNQFHTTPNYDDAGVYTIHLEVKNSSDIVVAETYRSVTISGGDVNLYEDLLFNYPFSNSLDNIVGSNSGDSSPDTEYYFDRKGNPNSAFQFNGIRFIDTNSPLPTTNKMTISFWIKQTNSDYSGFGDIIANSQLYIGYDNGNIKIVNKANTSLYSISSSNSWIHFVIKFNKDGTIQVYENATIKGNTGNWSSPLTGGNNINIGKKHIIGNPFDGLIDDIKIYNRILNQLEINALYNE